MTPNMKFIQDLADKVVDYTQEDVFNNRLAYKKHSTALVFEFPPGYPVMQLVSKSSNLAERAMRLCESFNRPDTIKVDFFTRTDNGGCVPGVLPGVEIKGEPMSPEIFLGTMDYTAVLYFRPQTFQGSPFNIHDPVPESTSFGGIGIDQIVAETYDEDDDE